VEGLEPKRKWVEPEVLERYPSPSLVMKYLLRVVLLLIQSREVKEHFARPK
jgi:hypothetical protein